MSGWWLRRGSPPTGYSLAFADILFIEKEDLLRKDITVLLGVDLMLAFLEDRRDLNTTGLFSETDISQTCHPHESGEATTGSDQASRIQIAAHSQFWLWWTLQFGQ